MHQRYGAIITAAGASRRFGAELKKEYHFLNNKPVLVHSLQIFIATGFFGRIVVTIPPGDREQVIALLHPFLDPEKIILVPGGSSRQNSVYKGLLAFSPQPPEIVLIHDGARPRISPEIIRGVLEKTIAQGGAIPVVDMVNALVEVNAEGKVLKHLDRDRIKGVQTPQGFRYAEILAAHKQALVQGVEAVDDATLYNLLDKAVSTVPGDPNNTKITFPGDLL